MPFIRLDPHQFKDLPSQTDPQALKSSITSILHEASPLLTNIQTNLQKDPKPRPSHPSTAQVTLSQGWHSSEFWVCRQSDHQDATKDGTASWREFEDGLRHDHAEHEMEYTPSVTGLKQLVNWNENDNWDPEMRIDVDQTRYWDFIIELNLIVHTFHPKALIRPRAFISLTLSAALSKIVSEDTVEPSGFMTVQVPFRLSDPEEPGYEQLCAEIRNFVPPRTIFAHYASLEHVELLAGSGDRTIRWTMATASEAGGKIPQWVQRNWTLGGVPKAVVADVGLFIGWVMKRRGQREGQREGQLEE
ncbi:unnamed protein product [Penicillium salamii]|nr:unnamed protein product [Penicillium salamii]